MGKPRGGRLTQQISLSFLAAGTSMLVGLGCDSDVTTAATTGSLTITTTSTGSDPDPDGYTLKFDSDPSEVISPNASLHRTEVNPGNHTVEIGGIAPHCTLSGEHVRTVMITAGETATVGFEVTCGPPTVIAFNRVGDGECICLMNPDGTGLTRLTDFPGYSIRWSRDRSKIVFGGGEGRDIYVINADGTGERRLTNTVYTEHRGHVVNQEAYLTLSPDGSRIAFAADLGAVSDPYNSEIYVINADGSGPINLTNNPGNDDRPAWSPDGSKIAYVGSGSLWIMNPDGSEKIQLNSGGHVEILAPTWSPDGQRIAFMLVDDPIYHTGHELHVVSVDGTGEQTIATGHILTDPIWSPDGRWIVYEEEFRRIVVISPDGTDRRDVGSDNLDRGGAVWSPDGSRIAYTIEFPATASSDVNYEIAIMDLASGAETKVTQHPAWDYGPAWAP